MKLAQYVTILMEYICVVIIIIFDVESFRDIGNLSHRMKYNMLYKIRPLLESELILLVTLSHLPGPILMNFGTEINETLVLGYKRVGGGGKRSRKQMLINNNTKLINMFLFLYLFHSKFPFHKEK